MKNPKFLILTLLALTACTSTLETTYTSQSTRIETYVSKQLDSHPEYVVTYNEGVVRMTVAEGDGDALAKGGRVTFRYAGYNFNSSSINANTLFATNDADIAAAAKWDLTDAETRFQSVTVTLGKDKLIRGLELGLAGVRAGEDCYVFFSGKYGFGKRQLGTIPANACICYRLYIEDVAN